MYLRSHHIPYFPYLPDLPYPGSAWDTRSVVRRPGFSLVELLIIVGILVGLIAMSVPLLTQYLVRSDLSIAAQLTRQGLSRARLLSRSGEQGGAWGYAGSGVIFRGSSYATRDPTADEFFPLPTSVEVGGLSEVTFDRISGLPDQTGDFILQSYGFEERVSVLDF